MNTKNEEITNEEMTNFFKEMVNPSDPKRQIDVRAYGLMAEYLKQIEITQEQQGMSQKELAKKVGVSASYLSQIFNLNKLAGFKILARIEKVLDMQYGSSIEHFLTQKDEYPNKDALNELIAQISPQEVVFNKMYAHVLPQKHVLNEMVVREILSKYTDDAEYSTDDTDNLSRAA